MKQINKIRYFWWNLEFVSDAVFYMKYNPFHRADNPETWLAGSQQTCGRISLFLVGQPADTELVENLHSFLVLSCNLIVGHLRKYLWISKKVELREYFGQKRDTSVHLLETFMAEGENDKFLAYWNIYLQLKIFYIVFPQEILLYPTDNTYIGFSPIDKKHHQNL